MSRPDTHLDQDLDPEDTARIDRRGTVLAQLEAALLADRLEVRDSRRDAAGRDPYDRSPPGRDVWQTRKR